MAPKSMRSLRRFDIFGKRAPLVGRVLAETGHPRDRNHVTSVPPRPRMAEQAIAALGA
jgi:hypothetical protein